MSQASYAAAAVVGLLDLVGVLAGMETALVQQCEGAPEVQSDAVAAGAANAVFLR